MEYVNGGNRAACGAGPAVDPIAEVLAHCRAEAAGLSGDAARLFHGRGQRVEGFGQVCIDLFPPVVLVTLYRPLEPATEQRLLHGLRSAMPAWDAGCLAVQRRHVADCRLESVTGELPPDWIIGEQGLRFRVVADRGQNLGFFPDMRNARAWLRGRAAGSSVLNLFAFTCAFSVAARAGGAGRVVNIDLSRVSLGTGRENHRLNSLPLDDVHFLDHDIFRSWNKLHRLGRYDCIVMDPPTLQKGSFVAERDYGKVVRRFAKLLKPESDVLACLNATHLGEDFLDDVFTRELPGSEKVCRLRNPPAFDDVDPQAALKVVHYRYRRPADLPPLG